VFNGGGRTALMWREESAAASGHARWNTAGLAKDKLKLLAETNIDTICELAMQHKPDNMVIAPFKWCK